MEGDGASLVGVVEELWRHPVKSLGGEQVERVELDHRGVASDRWWSVRGADGKLGSGKTTRRFRRMPGLLSMSSYLGLDGRPRIVFDDDSVGHVDDPAVTERVAAVVGEEVTLAEEADVPHIDDGAVHLLTSSSIDWLAAELPGEVVTGRRFRPNVLIGSGGAGTVEETWIGRRVRVGGAILAVERPAVRCVMVALAQDGLPFAPAIIPTLQLRNDLNLGVYASVDRPGPISLGDPVSLLDA